MTPKKHIIQKFVENFGPKMRKRRLGPLIGLIRECHQRKGSVSVIDIGGTHIFWKVMPPEVLEGCNVKVLIVNLPGVEVPRQEGCFTYEDSDGCDLGNYKDLQFDIAFSNSVVEHVGDWGRMKQFAGEARRVADNHFIQTPNFWFPVEPHCVTFVFHWLPFATRVWLLMHFDLGYWRGRRSVDAAVATAESAKLLNANMMRALFPDSRLVKERFFLLPKSLIAIRQRFDNPS
jgi:hypothetical protein